MYAMLMLVLIIFPVKRLIAIHISITTLDAAIVDALLMRGLRRVCACTRGPVGAGFS